MLVLGRRIGDKVEIVHGGETLIITVVTRQEDKIRLGFEGPETFRILRTELIERGQELDADHHATDRPFGVGIDVGP